MCYSDQKELEDRIFDLLDTHVRGRDICEELGLELDPGINLILKVFDERKTPNLVAAREAIDRLAAIRY